MSLRRRDVEQWMSHRRLPRDLRRFHIIRLTDLRCILFLHFPLHTNDILVIVRLIIFLHPAGKFGPQSASTGQQLGV